MEDFYFSKTHEWVCCVEDDIYMVGISDEAQKLLGDIVFVELPKLGTHITNQQEVGVIESVKSASDLFIPISGIVVEHNLAVVSDSSLINSDPYGSWLLKIKIDDINQLSDLMNKKQYETFVA